MNKSLWMTKPFNCKCGRQVTEKPIAYIKWCVWHGVRRIHICEPCNILWIESEKSNKLRMIKI